MRLSEITADGTAPLPEPLPFDRGADPGWYREGDHIVAYHGTHVRNVADILEKGLNRPDPKTGMISVTLDPLTAHAYAAMSGSGGEAGFRGAGGRATTTPPGERAVIRMRIPRAWVDANMDPGLGGNMGIEDATNDLVDARTRMLSREEYQRWRRANPNKPGRIYYTGTELRFRTAVPPEFIQGYMQRG